MNARHLAASVQVDIEREIYIDFNTLCEAERVEPGLSFLTDMSAPLSFHGMRAICYANWKRDDPTLTKERVGEILQDHWPAVFAALMEAWSAAMPDTEEVGETESDPTETTTAPH